MDVYSFNPGSYSSHALILAAIPGTGTGGRLLDVGCASGYLAALLAARGFDVTGIDAQRNGNFPAAVRFVAADLDRGLPELEGTFDWIVCADVIEHLREPASLLRAMRMRLAPGGKLVLSVPNSGHAWFRLNTAVGRFPKDDKGLFDRTHLHFWRWPDIERLLIGADLRIVEKRQSTTPFGLTLPGGRALDPIGAAFANVWPSLFAYQFILITEPAA